MLKMKNKFIWLAAFKAGCFAFASSISSCCHNIELASENALFSCVNSSITWFPEPYLLSQEGPTLSVLIISRITATIIDYAAYSSFLKAAYASTNGYNIIFMDRYVGADEDYLLYPKLVPLLSAFDEEGSQADYIVWMDADVSSMANSGCIIVKRSPWARAFLQDWLAARRQARVLTDQQGFDIVYAARPKEETNKKIAILPANALNSAAPAMRLQLPTDQVLHLATESSEMRRRVFQQGAKNYCDWLLHCSVCPFPTQLGLTRQFLQETALAVYGSSTRALLSLEQDSILNVTYLSRLRLESSKYVHVSTYVAGGEGTHDSSSVRWAALELTHSQVARHLTVIDAVDSLFQRFHTSHKTCVSTSCPDELPLTDALTMNYLRDMARTAGPLDHGPGDCFSSLATTPACMRFARYLLSRDLPEALKLGCELAFELLLAEGPGDRGKSRSLTEYLDYHLELLYNIVDPTQRFMVSDMMASLNIALGSMEN